MISRQIAAGAVLASLLLALGLALPVVAHAADAKLGKVNFPTSCNPAAQKEFEVAMAYYHSFAWPRAHDRARPRDQGRSRLWHGPLGARAGTARQPVPVAGEPLAEDPRRRSGRDRRGARRRAQDPARARLRRGAGGVLQGRGQAESPHAGDGARDRHAGRWPPAIPTTPRRPSSTRWCSRRTSTRPTRSTRTSSGRRSCWSRSSRNSPITRASPTISSTASTIRRSPRRASMRPGATRRSRLTPRTPSTCPRTSSPAWATGRDSVESNRQSARVDGDRTGEQPPRVRLHGLRAAAARPGSGRRRGAVARHPRRHQARQPRRRLRVRGDAGASRAGARAPGRRRRSCRWCRRPTPTRGRSTRRPRRSMPLPAASVPP